MSIQESRVIAVPKYFKKTHQAPKQQSLKIWVAFTNLGLIASLIGLIPVILFDNNDFFGFFLIGFVVMLFCGYFVLRVFIKYKTALKAYKKIIIETEPKPSDEQMDTWQQSDLNRIKIESLNKLDLLPEQVIGESNEPIVVVGPSIGALATVGSDNIVRFSHYDVVVVYLTDYHLAAYSCTIDLSNGLQTHESTQEYHYTDVVSVSTQTENSRIFKFVVDGTDKPLANYQKFALSVASGERIEVAISFPQLDNVIKNARLAPTGAENAVKIIRARLREKKGGAQE